MTDFIEGESRSQHLRWLNVRYRGTADIPYLLFRRLILPKTIKSIRCHISIPNSVLNILMTN